MNGRAILTARAGLARADTARAGFCPTAVQGTTPGSAGGFYSWRSVALPTTTWTAVRR